MGGASRDKWLLGLTMIVRNEAAGIVRTLESTVDLVDRWDIVDTGSTDDTTRLIIETATRLAMPVKLYDEPFVDFSTTRNRALELASRWSQFVLMLSGDEVVVDTDASALRHALWAERDKDTGAYDVTVRFGSELVYRHPRITRDTGGYRYVGLTHEHLEHPSGKLSSLTLADALTVHYDPPPGQDKTERWMLDVDLLERQLEQNPRDARAVFYLAQTHQCVGNLLDAANLYRKRAAMEGFREEAFESLLRIGDCLRALGFSRPAIEDAYLKAHVFSPHRAEPLYQLADYLASLGEWRIAAIYAEHAARMSYPSNDRLFVRHRIYESQARELAARCRKMIDDGRDRETRPQAAHP